MTETECRGLGSLFCLPVVLEIKNHSKTKYALATTAKHSRQRKAMSAKGVNSHARSAIQSGTSPPHKSRKVLPVAEVWVGAGC